MAIAAVETFDTADAAKRAYRTMKQGMRTVADVRDEAVYRVKRAPLTSVGLAFGGGVLLGAIVGFISGRPCPSSSAPTKTAPIDDQC